MIGGQEYLLSGRHFGYDAKAKAQSECAILRKQGKKCRAVKINCVDYMVYAHG